MKKYISTVLLLAVSFCGFAQNQVYQLTGSLPGYDKTYIYLRQGRVEDSTVVKEGKFSFSGTAKEPKEATLYNKGGQSLSFILENASYDVTSSNGNLNEAALVGGGPTQLQLIQLTEKKKLFMADLDRLESEYAFIDETDTSAVKDYDQQYLLINNKIMAEDISFVRANPKSFLSLYTVWRLHYTMPIREANELYKVLDSFVQLSAPGQRARKAFDAILMTEKGLSAADIEQPDVNGKLVKLSDYKGKFVLIDFWASWCAPCRVENPNVVAEYNKYHSKGFEVLGVSLDSNRDAWLKAITADGLNWTNVSDLNGWKNQAAVKYGVTAVPSNFLVDPAGYIIGSNLSGEGLRNVLNRIFDK